MTDTISMEMIEEEIKKKIQLMEEYEYRLKLIALLFVESCADFKAGKTMYDHNNTPVYQEAQEYLISKGVIDREECVR